MEWIDLYFGWGGLLYKGKHVLTRFKNFGGFFRRYFWGISVLYNTLYQVRVIERFTVPVLGRDFYTAFQVDSNYICACANCYVFEHDGMVYRKKLVYLTINRRVGHPAIRKNSSNMYVWFFIMRNNVLALQSSTNKQFLVSLSIPPNIHIVYSISCVVFTFSKFALFDRVPRSFHCLISKLINTLPLRNSSSQQQCALIASNGTV